VKKEDALSRKTRKLGRVAGPLLALLAYLALETSSLGAAGRATAAVAVWMAIWWITEAIPVFATALLPLATFPLFGIRGIRETAIPYGHELIFLFLGGFVVALSMERWGLHRRIATRALRLVGTRADHVVGAFIGITAFLSMWVSNTATAIMMLPIATSVIKQAGGVGSDSADEISSALLLGIAYGASIGGVATLIGTPPNLFLASFVRDSLGLELGFARWMMMALPLVVVLLVILWFLLTRVLFRCQDITLSTEGLYTRRSGPITGGEKATLIVFIVMATLWLLRPMLGQWAIGDTRPFAGLTDTGIAIIAAITLFLLPAGGGKRVMNWETMRGLPWGLLILFGGGLSLASAMQANGVSELIGRQLGQYDNLSPWLFVALATTLMVFLTELTSNTATTAAMVPIFSAVAVGIGMSPLMLATAAAVAASCAFMLPVATPPNAIVFAGGNLKIQEMIRAGIWMNLVCIVVVTTWVMVVVRTVTGG
jgi:sodium-dependent dicarboxylate transporter 2/3/5